MSRFRFFFSFFLTFLLFFAGLVPYFARHIFLCLCAFMEFVFKSVLQSSQWNLKSLWSCSSRMTTKSSRFPSLTIPSRSWPWPGLNSPAFFSSSTDLKTRWYGLGTLSSLLLLSPSPSLLTLSLDEDEDELVVRSSNPGSFFFSQRVIRSKR